MSYKSLKTMLLTSLLVVLFSTYIISGNAFAQDSYIDSIYKASGGSTQAVSDNLETTASNPEEGVTIDVGGEDATVTITSELTDTNTSTDTDTGTDSDPEGNGGLSVVNKVLEDMTRILVGMNMGIPIDTSNFTLISLDDEVSTDTNTATGTDTGGDTATDTNGGSATDTDGSTATDTDGGTATDTDGSTATDTDGGTATDTDGGSATDTGGSTATDTDGGTATDTDGNSDTNTITSTDTEDSQPPNTDPEEISNLKAKIKSTYNIECSDGTASFTLRQLELIDKALGILPDKFRNCTTDFIRDSKKDDNSTDEDKVMGYVIVPESKVHILNRATYYKASEIAELEEKLGRPISTAEIIKEIERNYSMTVVHEMTHCFQHSEDGKKVMDNWKRKFWSGDIVLGQAINNYARTSPEEDMAESVAHYVEGGMITEIDGKKYFKANGYTNLMDIDRYNFIKDHIMGGKEYLVEVGGGSDISI